MPARDLDFVATCSTFGKHTHAGPFRTQSMLRRFAHALYVAHDHCGEFIRFRNRFHNMSNERDLGKNEALDQGANKTSDPGRI